MATPFAAFLGKAASAATPVYTRNSVATLTTKQIASLQLGFATMIARPTTDPTSFRFQANMHGTTDPVTTPQQQLGWNACQHGTYFFFAWHRMYLYFFERILRAAAGDPTLTLPYWDWTDPAQRQLPLIFREPADATNSLYAPWQNGHRPEAVDDGTAQLADATVDYTTAFAFTNFTAPAGSGQGFGGQLGAPAQFGTPHGAFESAPHDLVHIALGGLMSQPRSAAKDPIFYLHHANIDRLWKRWLDQGGGRYDPSTTVWLTQPFTFFDENGDAVTMTPAQVLDTRTQLGYGYSTAPTDAITTAALRSASAVRPQVAAGPPRAWELLAQSVVLNAQPNPLNASFNVAFSSELARSLAAPGTQRVMIRFEGMRFTELTDVHYQIYANLPSGMAADWRNGFLVGTLSSFGRTMNMPGMGSGESTQDYDITSALRLSAAQPHHRVGDITLTFVPRTGLVDASQRPFPFGPGVRATIGNILVYVR